ncbi:hypothetical protein HK097_008379 [Rhizophlyctis rosea]|uniref:Uncharacterized protein n=1 Tax=Rhizophlyctis rosea TaxID=64517 RepID=A0AAD5SBX7_9FUNG|nr:hypothetical protein HK097_008379 [Rhizophlyctis rosea]
MSFSKPLPDVLPTSLPDVASLVDQVSDRATPALVATGAYYAKTQRTRRLVYGILLTGLSAYYYRKYGRKSKKLYAEEMNTDEPLKVDKDKVKVAVDGRFLRQLMFIGKICVPRWRSKTVGILALHTFFLVLRTYLSVIVARLDGRLVRDLVAADGKEFLRGLAYWFGIAVPATYTNSMIRYLQSKLSISLRTSLTKYVHDLYMSNNTYYKAINLDNRIDGADQLITTDINRFCNALASLYSNLGKPVLDMIIFNYQLARSIGSLGMWGLLVNYGITATILRAATPAFGKLAAEEAKLEGNFRSAHSRLITNAEEIAFYNGADLEHSILSRTYSRLIKHINRIYRIRIAYNMFEDFLIKYSWSAAGLLIAAIPVFFPDLAGARAKRQEARIAAEAEGGARKSERVTGSRTQGFITNKRLMISLADAGGRIMYSYKELNELAGYTYRVYNMLRVLQDLHGNKYVKSENAPQGEHFSLEAIHGMLQLGYNGIKFDNVPVATPNGDTLLIRDLTFTIGPGDHLMITGPNGAGKTSILRLVAGLWPLFRGRIDRPDASLDTIFYIPQRPYLAIGSLREQVIYPHSVEQMRACGRTEEDLMGILKKVYLEYIPGREGGWGAVKEWKDVFSGGEKQRMQLARLFYHRPRFAVLDEATAAVSTDVEALLYSTAKDEGITIVTISHRPSLFKYHKFLLRVGESGVGGQADGWTFEKIGGEGGGFLASVEEEIRKLEGELGEIEGLKERLRVINEELKLGSSRDVEGELKHAKRTLI